MACRICSHATQPLFTRRVLGEQIEATFSRCPECGFFQADNPDWLAEAYASPLCIQDTALVTRPLGMRIPAIKLIRRFLDPGGRFLDYGGGSGIFTRMMRDLGYQFFHQDAFAANELARGFDYNDLPPADRQFQLTTSFEVLEHTVEPLAFLADRMKETQLLLFSTELQPPVEELGTWTYLGVYHGQHISFQSEQTLRYIAGKIGSCYQRVGKYLHLYSKAPLPAGIWLDPPAWNAWLPVRAARRLFRLVFKPEEYWLTQRLSLTEVDNQAITSRTLRTEATRS